MRMKGKFKSSSPFKFSWSVVVLINDGKRIKRNMWINERSLVSINLIFSCAVRSCLGILSSFLIQTAPHATDNIMTIVDSPRTEFEMLCDIAHAEMRHEKFVLRLMSSKSWQDWFRIGTWTAHVFHKTSQWNSHTFLFFRHLLGRLTMLLLSQHIRDPCTFHAHWTTSHRVNLKENSQDTTTTCPEGVWMCSITHMKWKLTTDCADILPKESRWVFCSSIAFAHDHISSKDLHFLLMWHPPKFTLVKKSFLALEVLTWTLRSEVCLEGSKWRQQMNHCSRHDCLVHLLWKTLSWRQSTYKTPKKTQTPKMKWERNKQTCFRPQHNFISSDASNTTERPILLAWHKVFRQRCPC